MARFNLDWSPGFDSEQELEFNSKREAPCRFYFSGLCHFGNECLYSHDEKKRKSLRNRQKVCRFFLEGRCAYGDHCFNLHELRDDETETSKFDSDEDVESFICNICHESPMNIDKPFGLLECCDHCFCMDCIMDWRKHGKSSTEPGNYYACPVCRRKCGLVLKSAEPLVGEIRELQFIKFKEKAAKTECRDWKENGDCKRGHYCLYKHTALDGSDAKNLQPRELQRKLRAAERERRRVFEQYLLSLNENLEALIALSGLINLH